MSSSIHPISSSIPRGHPQRDWFAPLRQWLNGIEFHRPWVARLICRLIPCKCPFERDVTVLNRTYHIPALCQINPLYNEVVSLRFRALSYLADCCGEDVTSFVC